MLLCSEEGCLNLSKLVSKGCNLLNYILLSSFIDILTLVCCSEPAVLEVALHVG